LARKKTGETFWILASVKVITHNNEKLSITSFTNIEVQKKAQTDFVIANKELIYENSEKEKRAAELVLANKELVFQNSEKEKRANELVIANKTLSQYKFALDESSILAITDKRGVITHVNTNFCKISKYKKAELIGKDHRMVNSGYHSKNFFKDMWAVITKGNIWKGEIKNKAKDGTTYWVDTTIVPFLDTEGKPYKYLSIRSDITQRKIEHEKLLINEEKYYSLFENSLVPMFITDPKTFKTNYANKIAIKVLGYKSKKDFIENYNSILHFDNPADLKRLRKEVLEFGISKWNIVKLKKLDGTPFIGKLVSTLSSDKNFAQTAIIDITDQVRSHEELEEKIKERTLDLTDSLLREKELNEVKTRFVSFVSHEFRTPLATILSSSSLIEMLNKPEQSEQRLKHVTRISNSVVNLTDILNDFLAFSELEQGNTEIKNSLFNLPEFITTVLEELNEMLSKKNQQITCFHNGQEMVEQSGKILKNILLNLLTNASKYSANGKEIIITSTVINNKALIHIKDHGIGIPEKDQNKLYNQFFRASNAEFIQGTGLGLSIVKKYIELIKGKLEFTSKENEGTTFIVEFPIITNHKKNN
jgi:PAS domain S-box-containing protein